MVISFPVILKQLFHKGKKYPWPKPKLCPRCKGSLIWGHGFVFAYFDGFSQPFYLKRYRCPDCRCVMRLRPAGYFKRFRAPVRIILESIEQKEKKNQWLAGLSRTRQGHWFKALYKKIKAYLTDTWDQGMAIAFDHFVNKGQIPVSRSI